MSSSIVRELIEREFSKRDIQYFISGSFRFGYDTQASDLDVVVLDTSSDYSSILSIANELGGVGTILKSSHYISNLTEITLLGGKVHLVIFTKLDGFLSLKKEHEEVQSFLRGNPVLVHFIKEYKTKVKMMAVGGTIIYNIIKNVMKDFKGEEEKEGKSSKRLIRI